MSNTSEDNLKKLGFRYDKLTSNNEYTNYIYRFPVYKYNSKTLLECKLTLNINTKIITVDVYQESGLIYRQFYHSEYGSKEPIIEIINNNILKEFKKLHIKQIKHKEKGSE